MDKLNPQQILFIKYYTTQGETFGSGVLSYARAYDFKLPVNDKHEIITTSSEYNTCKANASRLLIDDNIIACKVELLIKAFDDDRLNDARLQEITLNGKDTDAIQAIKVRNDLKQRITKRLDITSSGRPLVSLSDDELKALAD